MSKQLTGMRNEMKSLTELNLSVSPNLNPIHTVLQADYTGGFLIPAVCFSRAQA